MAQTLGIIDLEWRGQKIPVEKGGSVMLGGPMASAVVSGRRVDFALDTAASEITITTPLFAGMSLMSLYASGTGPLQVTCDTGQVFAWDDAFLKNRPKFTSGEGGKVEMQWSAGEPSELLSILGVPVVT